MKHNELYCNPLFDFHVLEWYENGSADDDSVMNNPHQTAKIFFQSQTLV